MNIRFAELAFLRRWVFAAAAFSALAGQSAACRYNVRDIGFVDLKDTVFQVVVSGPAAEAEAFADDLRRELGDVPLAIAIDEQSKLQLASKLKSPDGRTKEIPSTDAAIVAEQIVSTESENESLARRLLNAHSVAVFVGGDDAAENERVLEQIRAGITEVEAGRAFWPKGINGTVELTVVEPASKDDIMLWNLGFDLASRRPQLAVVFGRCRRLGDVLDAERIAAGEFPKLVNVLCMDCECEYDIAPLVGPMIPHRWTTQLELAAVEQLGFDPGHPLVRIETAQILDRRDRTGVAGKSPLEGGFGYQEIDLPSLPPNGSPTLEGVATLNADSHDANSSSEMSQRALIAEGHSDSAESHSAGSHSSELASTERQEESFTSVWATIAVLLATAIVGSAVVIFWSRR